MYKQFKERVINIKNWHDPYDTVQHFIYTHSCAKFLHNLIYLIKISHAHNLIAL